jgi:hypothetical protein
MMQILTNTYITRESKSSKLIDKNSRDSNMKMQMILKNKRKRKQYNQFKTSEHLITKLVKKNMEHQQESTYPL